MKILELKLLSLKRNKQSTHTHTHRERERERERERTERRLGFCHMLSEIIGLGKLDQILGLLTSLNAVEFGFRWVGLTQPKLTNTTQTNPILSNR